MRDVLAAIQQDKFGGTDIVLSSTDGISLLDLKNEALLAYIADLLLVAAAQLAQNDKLFGESREHAIQQRVTLEKGVKSLEMKIAYQIDKVLRAYRKSLEVQTEGQSDDKKVSSENPTYEADSDSDFDPTAYRPNVASLNSLSNAPEENERYIAPKISANMPASETRSRAAPRRRDFAMEEYIRESGDAPVAEASVGSQIMDSGRGGERTRRERERDREVQEYEEANFTRISQTSSKRARKEAAQRQRDATTNKFFGEDWSFLDDAPKKRRKR